MTRLREAVLGVVGHLAESGPCPLEGSSTPRPPRPHHENQSHPQALPDGRPRGPITPVLSEHCSSQRDCLQARPDFLLHESASFRCEKGTDICLCPWERPRRLAWMGSKQVSSAARLTCSLREVFAHCLGQSSFLVSPTG